MTLLRWSGAPVISLALLGLVCCAHRTMATASQPGMQHESGPSSVTPTKFQKAFRHRSALMHWPHTAAKDDRFEFIDNGVIRVGVDVSRGGVIGYLAPSDNSTENVINCHDMGREVQLAFYAEPTFYNPPTAAYPKGACNISHLHDYVYKKFGRVAWPWAPIGAGDTDGNRAKILSQDRDSATMNITSRPLQWPCHNVTCECTFGKHISVGSVRGDGVRVDATLRNFRTDVFTPKPWTQELPAVYSNSPYYRLVTYNGSAPYTHAPTAEYDAINGPGERGMRPGRFPATEHWAAFVDEDGFGMGIVCTVTDTFQANFYGNAGPGGSYDPSTGYISVALGPNDVFEFTFHLVLGNIAAIRSYAYTVAGHAT
eukprot:m.12525 g.12525  ORF g.12525 m.12525 type:complete len:370 (+) comp4558_c0_seq1:90-1199(+)